MNRKRSQLLAYFAGIFDGEGCVGIYKRTQKGKWESYFVLVQVSMTDPQAAMLMWLEYPEARLTIEPPMGTNTMPKFVFRITDAKCERFLKDMKPFSLIKWEQIKIALSLIAHKRRNYANGRMNKIDKEAYLRRCERLFLAIKRLKQPNGNRVNSVNLLLDHGMREYRAKREDVEQDVAVLAAKAADLLERVETRHRDSTPVEAISALEQEIVRQPQRLLQ